MPSDALLSPTDSSADAAAPSAVPMTRREALALERARAATTPTASTPTAASHQVAVVHEDAAHPVIAAHPVARPSRRTRATRNSVVRVRQPHASVTVARTPKSRRGASFRRSASRVTVVGALLFVAGLVVSTSVPAQALLAPHQAAPGSAQAAAVTHGQSLTVGDTTADAIDRDGYTVSDTTQYAHLSNTFTNDPNGTIQWPFLTGVPITSGFGARNVEGCSYCSTFHEGADFAPGAGTPIRSVAAGTVIKVKADDGGYGNDVWVQHDVDGKQFVSVYGHMADGSFKVVQGQQVTVGQELGLVGSTGNSTGPHLHLEIHVDDVPVDPIAWLRANAN